jgi:isopentenyl-diphosphate delta-isomerase
MREELESVVLVDELDNVIGTMPKQDVHGPRTPLHRGFSAFLFRTYDHHLLLQRRSKSKITWPLMWSNSCCGHPRLGESNVDVAVRRIEFELGMQPTHLELVAPYRYCFTKDGIMENEICPILIGFVVEEPSINQSEIAATCWSDWHGFLQDIDERVALYSEWCREEARLLSKLPRFRELTSL